MAFEELKTKQSVMWGSGPYERVSDHLEIAHDHLLREVPAQDGEQWLDVATGTGEVAVMAASAGADVTGVDLAPGMIEAARERAGKRGTQVQFDVGDAEQLPYADASFDTVSSTFGVMFAPDQKAAAAELARVCKPGGRLGLLTWHATDGVAEFFKIMGPYQPPRPDGVGNPFDWGSHGHLQDLLGDSFELRFDGGDTPQPGESGQEIWELFTTSYGPTKALVDSLEEDRRAALRGEWVEYFEQFRSDGSVLQPRPYVLTLGTRR